MRENDSDLLKEYMHNFFGYGNLGSQEEPTMWFVGQEENGGICNEEINVILETWRDREKKEVENLQDFYCKYIEKIKFRLEKENLSNKDCLEKSIKECEKYLKNPYKQEVWTQLMNVAGAYKEDFNSDSFGNHSGAICSLELLPLPYNYSKKDCTDWIKVYGPFDIYSEPGKNKMPPKKYYEEMIPYRICKIKKLIGEYKPEFVIFYIMSFYKYYKKHFKEILDVYLENNHDISGFPIYKGKLNNDTKITKIVISYHPAAKQIPIRFGNKKNDYFSGIGGFLKDY